MAKAKTLYSKESKALTDWLKLERARAGFTIRELAAELGWAPSIVGKIEQGERRLDVVEFVHYCNALNASPQQGIKSIDNKKR